MLTLDDRLAIHELYAVYAHQVDSGDGVGWAGCFTDAGYLAVPVNGIHAQGREALEAFAAAYFRRSGGLERHLVDNVVLEEADSGVTGRCYLTMLVGGSGGQPPRLTTTGTYEDRLERTADGWRFAARELAVDVAADG